MRDDDADGVGEVLFVYRLACRSDVSSAEQKLLMTEDGVKHILRGRTGTPFETVVDPKPEPAAGTWPKGTYSFATKRFRELAPEFEAPPG